jgi:hypothetical protein
MDHSLLIQSFCDDLKPVEPDNGHKAIIAGTAVGVAASLFGLLTIWGIQPDLDTAPALLPFLGKAALGTGLAYVALNGVIAYARPGESAHRFRSQLGAVAAVAVVAALGIFSDSSGSGLETALLGASWQSCSARIILLSLPLIAAMIYVVRQQAPVRLRNAGAAIGLFSGAAASVIYALTCTESAASFVLLWYSLGISAATAIGAFLGPKFLRW